MQILLWIIFGGVAGYIAHIADTTEADGSVSTTVFIGVLGAVFGGIFANVISGDYLFHVDLTSFTVMLSLTILALLVHRTVFTSSQSRI